MLVQLLEVNGLQGYNIKNTIHDSNLDVSLISCHEMPFNKLNQIWLEIENNAQCHVFLSWPWISCWLRSCPQEYKILLFSDKGIHKGIAVIFESKRKLFKLFNVKQWLLNRTGNEKYDQCWIEYNDILAVKGFEKQVAESFQRFIASSSQFDELIIGMSNDNRYQKINGYSKETLLADQGYLVDFTEIDNHYLEEIPSRNTRQKINKTKRLLESKGDLRFEIISDKTEKLGLLPFISEKHKKKWDSTKTPSGFNNPVFSKYFKTCLESDFTQLATLSLDGKPIAVLVNYIYQQNINFYLSAINYDQHAKLQLGMLVHSLAIEHYRKQGFKVYDFLVGDARYKKSLSTDSYQQIMTRIYNNKFSLNLEMKLKSLKN